MDKTCIITGVSSNEEPANKPSSTVSIPRPHKFRDANIPYSDITKKHITTNTVLQQPTTATRSSQTPTITRPLDHHINATLPAPTTATTIIPSTRKPLPKPPRSMAMTGSQPFISRQPNSTMTRQQTLTHYLPRPPTFTPSMNYHPT